MFHGRYHFAQIHGINFLILFGIQLGTRGRLDVVWLPTIVLHSENHGFKLRFSGSLASQSNGAATTIEIAELTIIVCAET
jgi:hypothetical protein